jgi:peptidoglycan/xylan/chitin deacetylase (PgdA/CDA1 family)
VAQPNDGGLRKTDLTLEESVKSKLLLITVIFLLTTDAVSRAHGSGNTVREVAMTFDDLPGVQMGGAWCNLKAFEAVNRKLINTLKQNKIPALGLVVESRWCEEKKPALAELLEIWLDAGLELGNHSYSHFDLNTTPLNIYQADVIRGEATIQKLLQERGLKLKYFRHPYLHAGKDIETKRAVDRFLVERGYKLAPVTIDNQEWVFAEVYARALRKHDVRTMQRVGTAYISYMEGLFDFFEKLSVEVLGYEIKQVLLLHDNPLNADYLPELVQMIRSEGTALSRWGRLWKTQRTSCRITMLVLLGYPGSTVGPSAKGMPMKAEPAEPQWIKQLFQTR